jgi:uncharacterized protein (TIGR02300 family)
VVRERAFTKNRVASVGKPELGTKRICPSCGAKYYDLNRDPITCPHCGTIFEVAVRQKAPERAPAPLKKVEEDSETTVEREEDLVSLEEAEAEAEVDVGPDVEDEEAVVVPDAEVDVEEDIETPDDTFLQEEEEEGDDVSGLLDVDAEDEDDR